MKKHSIYNSIFSIILPIGLALSIYAYVENREVENSDSLDLYTSDEKQKGAHVFGHLDSANIQQFVEAGYEWITIVPFGDQEDYDSPSMSYYKEDSIKAIQKNSRWKSQIEIAHEAGLKVFIKPHVWIYSPTEGKWRSDIYPKNDNHWKQWKESYREFILLHATIAEQNGVELFCIGTEFSRLSTEKANFWRELIREVRSVYSGKLTYAANWYKEYEEITFWDELDYIGIQAYFPLSKKENPSIDQISKGWKKYLSDIEFLHKKYNRKILFTEMGYKSTSDSAIAPWEWLGYDDSENPPISHETQANCYQAFFNTVWQKDWLAGVHVWQLRSDFVKGRGKSDLNFTPQGKTAERVIKKGFE